MIENAPMPKASAAPLHFAKYHGLGNDYLVVDGDEWSDQLFPGIIRRVCNRHYGIGSDGVLVHDKRHGDTRLRILNPDGSEAEKSGNGLRIFSRYLWDKGLVGDLPFAVTTPAGTVRSQVMDHGRLVAVDMGQVSFSSDKIPVVGPAREVLRETMTIGDQRLTYCAATIGNPHCVVLLESVSEGEAKMLGPLIEIDRRFPDRTNVQFMQILDRRSIRIEIWERGAGYTLASGSSSCAAAAVARRLGLVDSSIAVHMPGGALAVEIDDDYRARQAGPVIRIAEGQFYREALEAENPFLWNT